MDRPSADEAGLDVSNASGAHIHLEPSQVGHFHRLNGIYEKYSAALDTSVMGSGKTYTSLALAIHMGLPIFVICPKTSKPMWTALAEEHGVPIIDVINYESLRSRRFCKLRHPWLVREDKKTTSRVTTVFRETPMLNLVVEKGALFIFDEVHLVRNASAQTAACHALMHAVFKSAPTHAARKSRVLVLSGTPATTPEECCRHMRIIGVYTQEALCTFSQGQVKLLGADSIVKTAFVMDAPKTKAIIAKNAQLDSHEAVINFCYSLYLGVIQDHIVACMPPPPIEGRLITTNLQLDLEGMPAERKQFLEALKGFESHLFTGERSKKDDESQWYSDHLVVGNLAKKWTMQYLQQMELSIVPAMVSHALRARRTDPRAKLVFMFSFRESIEKAVLLLEAGLGQDTVGVLTGEVTDMQKRADIVARFQKRALVDDDGSEEDEDEEAPREPTDTAAGEKPLIALVGILRIMAIGISLHDTVGDEPRHAYIASSSDIINTHQGAYRFHRMGSKGTATVNICYGYVKKGDQVFTQTRMLDAIARRSKTFNETLDVQVRGGVRFPGEYPLRVARP